MLGKSLGLKYRDKLMQMVDFIKQQEKVLGKPIKDLDDCRYPIINNLVYQGRINT